MEEKKLELNMYLLEQTYKQLHPAQRKITLIFIFLLFSNTKFLIRNIDTIKELTDILVTNKNRLIDLSSYE